MDRVTEMGADGKPNGKSSSLNLSSLELVLGKLKESKEVHKEQRSEGADAEYLNKHIHKHDVLVEAIHKVIAGTTEIMFCRPAEIDTQYNCGRKLQQTTHEATIARLRGQIIRAGAVNHPLVLFTMKGSSKKVPAAGRHRTITSLQGIKAGDLSKHFVVPYADFSDVYNIVGEDFMREWFTTENQKDKESHIEPDRGDIESGQKPAVKEYLTVVHPDPSSPNTIDPSFLQAIRKTSGKNCRSIDKLKKHDPKSHTFLLKKVRVHTNCDPETVLRDCLDRIQEEGGLFYNNSSGAAKADYLEKDKPCGSLSNINSIDTDKLFHRVLASAMCKKERLTATGDGDGFEEKKMMLHIGTSGGLKSPSCVFKKRKSTLEQIGRANNFILRQAGEDLNSKWVLPVGGLIFAPAISRTVKRDIIHYPPEGEQTVKNVEIIAETSFRELSTEKVLELAEKVLSGTWTWQDFHCEY
tara:strand:- start:79 stop:1479 length:1401 start_codon:yes stop_codon:yes gene_type:complete